MKSDQEFVDNLVRVVKQNYTNPNFDVCSMAGAMMISDRQLQRRIKALTGQTPVQYLRGFRLEISLPYLQEGVPVGDVAKVTGFSSHTYFTCCFKAQFGITPQQAKDKLVVIECNDGGILLTNKTHSDRN
jgi:transcriptional regulator GlxA family with amidase domain